MRGHRATTVFQGIREEQEIAKNRGYQEILEKRDFGKIRVYQEIQMSWKLLKKGTLEQVGHTFVVMGPGPIGPFGSIGPFMGPLGPLGAMPTFVVICPAS